MMHIALAAVAVMLVTTSAVANDQQFNLVCNGTKRLDMTGAATSYVIGFSVDLEKKQICLIPCKSVVGLTHVDPDVIEFEDFNPYAFPGPDIAGLITISRENGKLSWGREYYVGGLVDEKNGGWSINADCMKSMFTGFPSNSF